MISVLIPVHNGELYLAETIQSVFSQTYRDFEIIVVDDGSTDETARVVAEFPRRVNYYYQPNRGIGATQNRLIELAAGDFLAFVDADDCWTADKLDLQIAELSSDSKLEAVFGMIRQVPNDSWEKAINETLTPPDRLIAGYSVGTMLIRRESFRRVGFFPTENDEGQITTANRTARKQSSGDVRGLPREIFLENEKFMPNGFRPKLLAGDERCLHYGNARRPPRSFRCVL